MAVFDKKNKFVYAFISFLSIFVFLIFVSYLILYKISFSGNARLKIDNFLLYLASKVKFLPSYLYPFPRKDYPIDYLGKSVFVGYGFIDKVEFVTEVIYESDLISDGNKNEPVGFSSSRSVYVKNLGGDFLNFNLSDNFDIYILALDDITLRSTSYFPCSVNLACRKQLESIFGSIFDGAFYKIPDFYDYFENYLVANSFVRYYYDIDKSLVRIDVISSF
jgi:hypothetical protein